MTSAVTSKEHPEPHVCGTICSTVRSLFFKREASRVPKKHSFRTVRKKSRMGTELLERKRLDCSCKKAPPGFVLGLLSTVQHSGWSSERSHGDINFPSLPQPKGWAIPWPGISAGHGSPRELNVARARHCAASQPAKHILVFLCREASGAAEQICLLGGVWASDRLEGTTAAVPGAVMEQRDLWWLFKTYYRGSTDFSTGFTACARKGE